MLLILAAGFSVAAALPARAQAVPAEQDPDAPAAEAAAAADAGDADIKDLELDWSQLNVDASSLDHQSGLEGAACSASGGRQ
jgi:hypothetical protein